MGLVGAACLVAAAMVAAPAMASHPLATLPGSNFEIDDDANLKLDDPAPAEDWGVLAHPNGPELRATDVATGQNDDSYKGGVKEDTECPGETTGSIPNNKSDLLTFHVYEEAGTAGHPGFLNLAWSRVSDPSGTTLMDFEFNQSEEDCGVGPNKVRTVDDLLIEYAIDQGGARAEISGRFWTGSAWGPVVDLDDGTQCGGGPCAVGTINTSVIPAGESDGLGEKQARTFGEAQIDLRLIFNSDECVSFGSAMLKSRSSDAFTSQLKDFIRPIDIDLQNCGNVIIRKQTDPDEDPNTTLFGYTKSFNTAPATPNTFQLTDDGVQDYNDQVLFGSNYTVTEDVIPANWEFVSLDCSASSAGTTYLVNGTTVTFSIDSDTDELDCTYTNKLNLGAIKITKDRKHAASDPATQPHPGVTFTVTGGGLPAGTTVTTDANGVACLDGLAFAGYTVTESVPAGYVSDDSEQTVTVDNTASCGDDPYGGESVAFHNTPLTNVTVSVDSQIDGGTASTIVCTDAAANESSASTGANGDGSLTVNNLLPTDPTVTLTCEITVDP
ncbi:MAG TPA: prealbumin-like fold domain-containing protein [Jiangellaceae bacterium]|nr:prealbumin-like fold domain-containing protein [Jiangellaceae bacterium]